MAAMTVSTKYAADVDRCILEVVKEARKDGSGTLCELGRRLFTRWHCGKRMVQVRVFINGARGFDEVVCPVCLHHYTLVSTSYEATDG